jgi:hypothetical protein
MMKAPAELPELHRRVFLSLCGAAAAVMGSASGCAHDTSHEPPEIIFAVRDGFDLLDARVADHVSDSTRAAALRGLIEASRGEFDAAASAMADQTVELASLSDDELADRARVEELLEQHADGLAAVLTSLSMHAAEARKQTTAEEWSLLFRPEDAARGADLVATQVTAVGVAASLGGINVFDQLLGFWDDALKATVKDAGARSKAAEALATIRSQSQGFAEVLDKDAEALQNVNLDYAAPIEAYAPVVEQIRTDAATTQAQMLDAAFAMRESIGPRAFAKARRKARAAVAHSLKRNRKEEKARDKATRKRARKQ